MRTYNGRENQEVFQPRPSVFSSHEWKISLRYQAVKFFLIFFFVVVNGEFPVP